MKKFTRKLFSMLTASLLLLAGQSQQAFATYTPISLIGFNEDLIANGAGPASGSVSLSTGFDGFNNVFVAQDFSGGATAPTYFLPSSGTVSSLQTPGLSYQLASYTGNNSLRLSSNGNSATLTFATPQANVSQLFILGTSGNGASTFDVTVNYAGGAAASLTFSLSFADWYGGTAEVAGIGRVRTNDNVLEGTATTPNFQRGLIDVSANYAYPIESIDITKTGGAGILGVMAVSANDVICSGAVTAGTSAVNGSATAAVCPNTSIALTNTPANNAAGLSFQWYTSTDNGATWNMLSGATTQNYTLAAGVAVATDFRLTVTCNGSGSTDNSNVVSITMNPPSQCYCTPVYTLGCNVGGTLLDIENVSLTGENGTSINQTATGCSTGGYADYRSLTPTQLAQASSYTINTTIATAAYQMYYATVVWIDFDDNGVFDSGEQVGAATGNLAIPITIPASALSGNHVMRLRSAYLQAVNGPCNTNSYGETHDYTINIPATTACSGAPAIATVSGPASVCNGQSFSLTSSGYTLASGITYQWESSPVGANTWTPISGANGTSYSSTMTTATDYHMVTTCNVGGSTASNTLSVALTPASNCYCTPIYSTGCSYAIYSLDINNLQLNGAFGTSISQTGTGCSPGAYADYTTTVAPVQLAPSGSYSIDMTQTSPDLQTQTRLIAWIDFGDDGSFDAADQVGTGTGTATTMSIPITMPAAPNMGPHRMRVRMAIAEPVNGACGSNMYGETQDYRVVLTSTPLYTHLVDIKAVNEGSSNMISWSTAREDMGDYFELEQSNDGKAYNLLTRIDAKGSAAGYAYRHTNAPAGMNYYRLKMLTKDGNYTYSKVVTASVARTGDIVLQAIPNPVKGRVQVRLSATPAPGATLTISDIAGRSLRTIDMSSNTADIDMSSFNAGIYLIRYTDTQHSKTIKIDKQ